ncbi:unnamed protein product [Arabis nemorensis]|uniref:Uncharacterized protein n=1 Tax=Arabis nemorensis TaxID=586526 RepID=A0A565AZ47_9BRAS|nr:unnamed protein product [Arabis nemorensis]
MIFLCAVSRSLNPLRGLPIFESFARLRALGPYNPNCKDFPSHQSRKMSLSYRQQRKANELAARTKPRINPETLEAHVQPGTLEAHVHPTRDLGSLHSIRAAAYEC